MILVNNSPFPSKFAQWQQVETKTLMDELDADMLCMRRSKPGQIHYEEMKEYYDLRKYNIFIFDPYYNSLNDFNVKFDGTRYNNRFPGCFFFSQRRKPFNILNYDIIYHIFLSRYTAFNSCYSIPLEKQILHLYPGGRFSTMDKLNSIDKRVNIISTQRIVTNELKERGFQNFVEVLGAPLLLKGEENKIRGRNLGRIRVCHAAFGRPQYKGGNVYVRVAEKYKENFPSDDIEFIAITPHILDNDKGVVKQYGPMAMKELKILYDSTDIYVSPEMGATFNGWPLGPEAVLRGSVLITTDNTDQAKYYKFSKSVIIVGNNNVDQIVGNIKKLYDDRELLEQLSIRGQREISDFYSYDNRQKKIIEFINEVIEKNKATEK